MTDSLPPIEIAPRRPAGWKRLARRDPDGGQPGCALWLALPTGVVGFGSLWLYFSGRAGRGTGELWIVPVVGFAFAAVALVLVYAGLRGLRGRAIPAPEVWLEKGVEIHPGARLMVRVRQPGPATIEQLVVKAVCQRTYRRPVGGRSKGTVEDVESIWEQRLLEIRDQPIAAGSAVERELTLSLPAESRPTGPALEGGSIRWAIEVWGEAGFLRATYHPFVISVQGGAEEES